MNKIYKVVWNKARNCYVVGSELMKTHQGKKSSTRSAGALSKAAWALFWGLAGWGAACNFIYADVTVADSQYNSTVTSGKLANGGTQYDIHNQQVSGKNALNKFENFGINKNDGANMHLGQVDHQINLVQNRIDIDGVVNAIKNNQIGGDVYFFSDKGIAIGANGVFNVGRLTLGTNAAYGEALFNGKMDKHLQSSVLEQARAVSGDSDISLKGKIYAQGDVILGASQISLEKGEIRTYIDNAGTYADKKSAQDYRSSLINVQTPSATIAKDVGNGDIVLAAVGTEAADSFYKKEGTIRITEAYVDAGKGNTTISATAEKDSGNLWASMAKAGVDISKSTVKGNDISISAETSVSGQVGTKDAYTHGAETGGIFGVLNEVIGEQVGSVASVAKTTADAHVTIIDSTVTADNDLTISATAESEITSEASGKLGVGINVGVADVESHVTVDGNSTLEAGHHLDLSAEGSNTIKLARQGEANTGEAEREKIPFAVDLGWAEAKTDVGVTVGEKATLKSQGVAGENEKDPVGVSISATARRALSVEVENNSNDGTLGVAAGVIQSGTKADADVKGNIYANGDVSVNAENTIDMDDELNPDSLCVTSESDDGEEKEPGIGDTATDIATTKGKGNQLMTAIKALMSDKSKEKKAEEEGNGAKKDDQKSATEAGAGLGLNAATAFLFSDNQAKASLSGKVRGYNENDGAGSVSVSADTVSRTAIKTGVSQGADKSVGIAAAVNYVDQNDKAEAELAGDIKTKGDIQVEATTSRPWESGLEEFGKDLTEDLKTIFDPNDGFELSNLTDSWTQVGGAGDKVSGAASLNIMEYNHTAKATIKNGTKIETEGDVNVSAVNDTNTINFSGDIKSPIGDQPGSKDFWEGIKESPFSGGGKAALGGAALTVHQKNKAEATVEDGVTIKKSADVKVNAENKGFNLSMAAAGGKGSSAAIDGTVNVNRFENTTKAIIGNATISSGGNVSVHAEDQTKNINIGGAVAVSNGTGIGATIAYNHIDRNTEAALLGTIKQAGNVVVTAQNTGAIYAMSAAGGVTMNSKTSNGAGSSGLHKQEGGSGSSTASIKDLAENLLNAGEKDTNKKTIDSGDSAIDTVTGKDASMSGNASSAKGGFAASANVSVNRITDSAKAYTKGSNVTADSLAVKSGNTSQIVTGAGALALGLSQNSSAIAGSFMYNTITDNNEAYVENSTLHLAGNREKDKDGKEINESLTVEADNAAKITNIAASGSGATKGSAVAGQISLNWVDNKTDAHVKDSTIRAGEAIGVHANDKGSIDSYTGAVAFSGKSNGAAVGAAIAVNLIQGDTTSTLVNTGVTGIENDSKAGKLDVTAEEASHISSIVASGAATNGMAAGFSASGNYISTNTEAKVDTTKAIKAGQFSVEAGNHSSATIGVGMAAVGKNAAGASVAVMVNDSTVNASLKGDENKQNTIEVDGLSVKADNQYNGSASDSETDSKAKTVAIGAAGGTSQFAGSGSVTVNVINQKTDATIEKGKYDAGNGKVEVEATSGAKLFGMAGGVALSAGSGLGAAVDVQTYTGRTYAGLADGVKLSNASAVNVNAASEEKMTSVAATLAGGAGSFAGAGAAGAHSITTDTKAYIGEEGKTEKAELENAGNISVTASDDTSLTTAAGSGAVSENTGVGLTAAVEVVNKTVNAYVGNNASISGNKLDVNAKNTSHSTTAAAGLGGGGTAGIAGAASETFVNHSTNAYVGNNAKVNVKEGANIESTSSFQQGAGAGGMAAAGTVAAGLANSTVSLNANTSAYVGQGGSVAGGKKVQIKAEHKTDLTYATIAGGVAGTAAADGTVGVNVLHTTTKAYAGNGATLSADEASESNDKEGISITASDTTDFHGGNGGVAIGISGGGAGVSVAVSNITKDTEAYVDDNAKLDSKGQITLNAQNTENIDNVSVQAAGGLYAGLAGAVNVMNLEAITKAYTNSNVAINQTNKQNGRYGGQITIDAGHTLNMTSAVGSAAVSGGASGGAAVDVANIKTQTNAYLGNGNTVSTNKNVNVQAKDDMGDITSHAYAASVGAVGLSGSISIYNIGSTMKEEDQNDLLNGSNFDTWVNGQLNKSKTKDAMEAYDGKTGALSDVNRSLNGASYKTVAPTTGEKGTAAKIGEETIINAGGDITVKAEDKVHVNNYMSSIAGSAFASAGASVSVVNTDTETKALIEKAAQMTAAGNLSVNALSNHSMDNIITGASISGGVSGQGTVQTWRDTSNVSALVKATKGVSAKSVSVTAENNRTLDSKLDGASVGLLGAVNGAVINAEVHGTSEAGIGDENTTNSETEGVTATEGDIIVSSAANTTMDATAIGAAAGGVSGTGTGVFMTSDVDAKSFIGKGEKLFVQKGKAADKGNISITATNIPKLSALATSAALGLAGMGATVANVTSKDTAKVFVGNGTSLLADGDLVMRAKMAKPSDGNTIKAHAIAGSGGVYSGAVASASVNVQHTTEAAIGSGVTIQAKTADILADHRSSSDLRMESISAGLASGDGGETFYTEDSKVNVSVGDNSTITTTDETTIQAENQTEKAQKALSGGASLAGGSGIKNKTDITHTTNTTVGSKVTIKASAVEPTEEGKTVYDKNAIIIGAHSDVTSTDDNSIKTGAAIKAAHIKNEHTVKADTTTNVGIGSTLDAGDTEAIKETNTKTFNTEGNGKKFYRGGSIAVTSSNDAKLTGKALVDVYGAAGYAGTENNVTYKGNVFTSFAGKAETAKGDIRVAAGRDAQGNAGDIKVEAQSDILNATAIPISSKKDPYAKIDSTANLTMSGDIQSDRDIYLQSNAGETKANGHGEVKDWVNAVAEAFGSEGGTIGKSSVDTKANAHISGTAETGIHRNKTITIGGKDNNGTWETDITTTGDISYSVSGMKHSSETLSKRLKDLRAQLADHKGDAAAAASYEAEIAFIEAKMIEQGLGYREGDTFVKIDPGTTTELEDTKNMLKGMEGAKDAVMNAIKEDQKAASGKQEAMAAMQTKHEDYTKAQTAANEAQTAYDAANTANTQAETAYNTAKKALEEQIKSSQSPQPGNDSLLTEEMFKSYIEQNKGDDTVKAYQTAEKNFTESTAALTKKKEALDAQNAAANSAKKAYEDQVAAAGYTKDAGYDPWNLSEANKAKITEDYNKLAEQQKAYANSAESVGDSIEALKAQIAATEDFLKNGEERDGKFYAKDGTEFVDGKYTYNGKEYTLLHTKAYPHMTRDVTIEDTIAQLGDIYLEGSNITGGGNLTAHGDAEVTITNNTPNNLVVGDIKVMGQVKNGQILQGGSFFLNGNALKSGAQVGDLHLSDGSQTADPTVKISSTFNPTEDKYLDEIKDDQGNVIGKSPRYSAPNLTLDTGKTIYNSRGKVSITSNYGDVYNEGSIVAGSVDLTAKNGDFIQSYSNRIANIGGDPFVEDKNTTPDKNGKYAFKKNEALGSGILANGNIFISARYVNINSKIQSGIADWKLEIPENPTFYYLKDGKTKTTITLEEAKTIGQNHTIYVDASGNMANNLTYDPATGRMVVSGVEVHGGKVSIVGTVINTTSDISKARIEALDGYGDIQIKNNSKYDLELKGLNTGEGVEGVIEITDLSPTDGKPSRKTTYTRKDGTIQMKVQQYQNNDTWTDGTTSDVTGNATYKPTGDQHYVFQTGKDSTVTNTYEYHGTKLDWWGISNKAPTRDELLAMGATITNTVTGKESPLVDGAFISSSNNRTAADGKDISIGNGKTKDWTVTNTSDVIDYSYKAKRQWYTLGTTKKYDIRMVIRDGKTTYTQYEMDASHDIGIGFNGQENGGTIGVSGGNGNVLISGTLSNTSGTTNISGASITQNKNGFINTGNLNMTATSGSVGSQDQSILTNATDISGSAVNGSFLVKSSAKDEVSVGTITAKDKVSLAVDNGMKQKSGATVKANRIELSAGMGGITGEEDGSFDIQAGQKSGKDYGLKASADGNISITNTGGDLYLDSVISTSGDVSLTTDGSFIDNNFEDVTDDTARAKLLAWAKAAVLEGGEETINRQKDMLVSAVQEKYKNCTDPVKKAGVQGYIKGIEDGVDKAHEYVNDMNTKASKYNAAKANYETLHEKAKNGGKLTTEEVTNLNKSVRTMQELAREGADTWTEAAANAYLDGATTATGLNDSYGKASLTKDNLKGDNFLTQDEMASVLVGSSKSAKDLLVTFAPGGIKEGITDTNTNIKGTPHVSGNNVSLIAKGGLTDTKGNVVSGDIGKKETGRVIDLSDNKIGNLTAEDLLALAGAERGDFNFDKTTNQVTVSSVRSIDAEAKGTMKAEARKGSIYLVSEGAVNSGSTFTSGGELRLKASGSVTGATIDAAGQVILESGDGKISETTVKGGALTARAKDGVDLINGNEGDLIINTIYASEGDVTLNLNHHSLVAEEGNDANDEETGTTYINVEGENITITNAKDIKGESKSNSLGMKVTGRADKVGSITAKGLDNAHVTIFGELKEGTVTDINAKKATITNRGHIAGGTFTGSDSMTIYNAPKHDSPSAPAGTISGGTFTGGTVGVDNRSTIDGGTITAGNTLTVTNDGTISDGTMTSTNDALKLTNNGTISGGTITAKNNISITNNKTISGGTYTSEAGDVSYNDADANSTISGGNLISNAGNVTVTAKGGLTVDTIQAVKEAKIKSDGEGEAILTNVTAGTIDINAAGSVHSNSLTSTAGDVIINAGKDIFVAAASAKQKATLVSGNDLTITGSLTTEEEAKLESGHDMKLEKVEVGALEATTKGTGSITGTTLTSKTGDMKLTAAKDVTTGTIKSANDVNMTATAGTLKADVISSNANTAMTSYDNMVIGKLTSITGKADLTSQTGDVSADILEIEKALSINAKKNVKLRQSKSVSLNATAEEGNIEAIAKDASISAGDIDLTAGDSIRVSDKETVNKLTGVDTSQAAGVVSSRGNGGSLITGEGKGHDFDVSKKGSASLVSSTGNMSLKAGTVEADTIQVGTSGNTKTPAGLTISADHIGIDDLTSDAERLDVKVTGKDGTTQSRYAGIHTTSDGDVILKDSQVEHLNFTGKDRIGLENTALGGDSVMATDKVTIRLDKNPSRPVAEGMGRLFVNGQDITSDRRFTDVRNGITLNGQRFPETATSVMNKSLYGNDSLGKDGKAKEEREGQDQKREIFFAPITDRESYQTVK